jgi:hypothetical protein
MPDRTWERNAPMAGIAAVILWVVGFFVFASTEVEGADTAAEILAGYRSDDNTILLGGWLFALGGVVFLAFVGVLRARLLAVALRPDWLTGTAVAGGIATGIFLTMTPLGDVAGALAADDLEPAAAQALNEMGTVGFVGAELSAVALLLATGLLVLRGAALPRWVGWISIVLAIWLVIGPIGWLGLILGFPLWVLLVSVLLWRAPLAVPESVVATGPGP